MALRSDKVNQLEKEKKELWSLYHSVSHLVQQEESVQSLREVELNRVKEDLEVERERVRELEEALRDSHETKLNDINYQVSVLTDISEEMGGGDAVNEVRG